MNQLNLFDPEHPNGWTDEQAKYLVGNLYVDEFHNVRVIPWERPRHPLERNRLPCVIPNGQIPSELFNVASAFMAACEAAGRDDARQVIFAFLDTAKRMLAA